MSEKRTILLIDDETELQEVMKFALESRGYKVEVASDGLEGLEKLKTLTPNLIILDLNMPNMGGIAFYQKICDSNNRPKYPVLVLTARGNMAQLFKDFIIDGFITKPFDNKKLLDEVDTIINNKFGTVKTIKVSGVERTAKVCIVENDPEEQKKISAAFLNCGYVVKSASNGTEAIEHIYEALPDIALVKLGLPDISGDSVVLQLKGMAKTRNVIFILYMHQSTQRTVIIDKISQKAGIDCFMEYLNEQQLINTANELLKQYLPTL